MKAAIVQLATPGATGNQDYTDAVFSSDVKGAIIISSSPTSTGSNTADFRHSIGFMDGTNQSLAAIYGQDATVGASNWRRNHSASNCFGHTADSSTFPALGSATIISTGIRANWSAVASTMLHTALILGGSDTSCAKLGVDFTGGGGETKTVNHGGSRAPDLIFCCSHFGATGSTTARGSLGFGCWTPTGSVTNNADRLDAQATEQAQGRLQTGEVLFDIGSAYGVTIGNANATSFDVTTSADASTDHCDFLAVWIDSVSAKTGTMAINTTTGAYTAISGLSKKPAVVVAMISRQTAVGTDNTDAGGIFGISFAVNNNGTIQHGGSVSSSDDGAATQVNKSQTTATQLHAVLNTTGAVAAAAAVTAFNTDGSVTMNAGTANGTAYLAGYAAFGNQTSGGAGLLMGVG